MFIYYYAISENHSQKDTDAYIIKSAIDYAEKNDISCNIEVKRTSLGKPYIPGNAIYVGVTHTEKLLIIAVGDTEFGIDCEKISRAINNPKRIIKKYFSTEEEKYVIDGRQQNNERFLEIWVKKEAYLKFLGTGFADIKKADTFKLPGVFEKIEKENYIIYVYNEKNLI